MVSFFVKPYCCLFGMGRGDFTLADISPAFNSCCDVDFLSTTA